MKMAGGWTLPYSSSRRGQLLTSQHSLLTHALASGCEFEAGTARTPDTLGWGGSIHFSMVLQFEPEVSPTGSHICTPPPRLVVLFGEVVEPLGQRALLAEAGTRGGP